MKIVLEGKVKDIPGRVAKEINKLSNNKIPEEWYKNLILLYQCQC